MATFKGGNFDLFHLGCGQGMHLIEPQVVLMLLVLETTAGTIYCFRILSELDLFFFFKYDLICSSFYWVCDEWVTLAVEHCSSLK